MQVVERARSGLGARQHGVVEGDRAIEDLAEPRLVGVLALRPLVDLDARTLGERPQRLRERDTVTLHDETEDVAAQPAAEAVPVSRPGVTTNDGVFSPWNGQRPL